jgi:hypothetical protein
VLQRDPGQIDARGDVELAEHLAQVERDGVRADEQLVGYLLIGQALGTRRAVACSMSVRPAQPPVGLVSLAQCRRRTPSWRNRRRVRATLRRAPSLPYSTSASCRQRMTSPSRPAAASSTP